MSISHWIAYYTHLIYPSFSQYKWSISSNIKIIHKSPIHTPLKYQTYKGWCCTSIRLLPIFPPSSWHYTHRHNHSMEPTAMSRTTIITPTVNPTAAPADNPEVEGVIPIVEFLILVADDVVPVLEVVMPVVTETQNVARKYKCDVNKTNCNYWSRQVAWDQGRLTHHSPWHI